MSQRKSVRTTGDSPFNVRNERGSKQSCLVRAAELLGFGGIVAATAVALGRAAGYQLSLDSINVWTYGEFGVSAVQR